MSTERQTHTDVKTAPDGRLDRENRPPVTLPSPFVYELDDVAFEIDMHRYSNAPKDLLRALVLVFKTGTLAGFKLHGFSVWRDERRNGRTVRYPTREWTTPGEGHKRPWALLRGIQKNDFTAHRRLDELILAAVDAAPPLTVIVEKPLD